MKLADLVGDIEGVTLRGKPAAHDVVISGLTADSRQVKPGYLFAALAGVDADGAAYVPQAIENGAAAILAGEGVAVDGVPSITADEPRLALAHVAAKFFPGQPGTICAVTGTNGKTSVASFLRQIWSLQGKKAASIGTLGVVTDDCIEPLAHTTPDPIQLHEILHNLNARGVTHVVLEASSHALAQYRVDGVRLKGAAITNLSRDHLDYHHTFEDYSAAKLRLFSDLVPRAGWAVVNTDTDVAVPATEAAKQTGAHVITVGSNASQVKVKSIAPDASGSRVALLVGDNEVSIRVPLIGSFQVDNALMAGALSGDAPATWLPLLERLEGAEGRMQLAGTTANGAHIYVDYAHTPDALEVVLTAMRPHTTGQLSVVFGCGGDRDKGKRPQMGAVASKLADTVYVTDDNPRFEDPDAIRADVIKATTGAVEIGDRRQAIATAINALNAGDVLVVAGKGHETGQTKDGVTHPFKDAAVIAEILNQSGGSA